MKTSGINYNKLGNSSHCNFSSLKYLQGLKYTNNNFIQIFFPLVYINKGPMEASKCPLSLSVLKSEKKQ